MKSGGGVEKSGAPTAAPTAEAGRDRVFSRNMLKSSLLDIVLPTDSLLEVEDIEVASGSGQGVATPSYYPQSAPPVLYNPALYKKLDAHTLFYVFYTKQNTAQQYYAAVELKKQYWRYHTQLRTWFQRHPEELPKEITADHEKGTYVFFDYSDGWCQRQRSDFTFEYKYLEDK